MIVLDGTCFTVALQCHTRFRKPEGFWYPYLGFRQLVLFFLVFVGAGCGSGIRDEFVPLEPGQGGVYLGGTFRWNALEDVRSLDPIRVADTASGDVAEQIYDGLVEVSRDLHVAPSLAERWDISDDGLTYTFYLRRGARFHDDPCFPEGKGRECTAQDIVYSLQRVVSPDVESIGLWAFRDLFAGVEEFRFRQADRVAGLKALDDYTVQITLAKPFAPFLQRLAMSYGFIIPHEAVDYYGADFFQHPVGTGPFQFVRWTKDLELVLERNPHYWEKDEHGNQLPYLGRLVNTFIKVQNSEFAEFELGNLETHSPIADDLFTSILSPDGNLKPKYDGRFNVSSSDVLSIFYFGFNMESGPFASNQKLRQAVNYAIDRESIIRHVLKGRALPFTGVVPPGMPGWKSTCERYEYNPEKAIQLMAEAGHPNGEGLPEIVLHLNSGGKRHENIAEVVQEQLKEIGIDITLQILEWPQLLEVVETGRSSFFRMGWQADYVDPENFLALYDSRKFGPQGPNYTHYKNERYDALFQAAERTTDLNERYDLMRQAEEIAVEDAPWLYLYHQKEFRLNQNYVHDFEHNAMAHLFFKYAWLEPHEN